MAVCKNCGVTLSCGCQKRVSKNGIECCSKCVMKVNQEYAAQLMKEKTSTSGVSGISVTAHIKK